MKRQLAALLFLVTLLTLGPQHRAGAALRPLGCTTDQTTQLQTLLNQSNTTIDLPTNGCYIDNGNGTTPYIIITGQSNLTINGHGTTFDQTLAATTNALRPMVMLIGDTNVTINNLRLVGAWNGSNGGSGKEGNYGYLIEASHGVTVTRSRVNSTQGDFLNLQFVQSGPYAGVLNSNITFSSNHFTDAGYHQVTIEAVGPGPGSVLNRGAMFSNNTFDNVIGPAIDSIDFEYDLFSTEVPDSRGIGTGAAEDNITFAGNEFSGFQNQWFVSIQGGAGTSANSIGFVGVQARNNVLSGNTIHNPNYNYSLCQVSDTDQSTTPDAYTFHGLTITNNRAYDKMGGAAGGGSATCLLTNATQVHIANNNFPIADGTCTPFVFQCNNGAYNPTLPAVKAVHTNGLYITNNRFLGAVGILDSGSSGNAPSHICGNYYLVIPPTLDSSCP